jgi:hypothetical protein
MTPAHFMELAADKLSSGDLAVLGHCTLDPELSAPPTSSAFVNHWREWERALRLNLSKNRAQKLKRSEASGRDAVDVPEHPADAVSAAKNAMLMESPLEAEIYLDKARWDAIENFQGISTFSEDAIYAYLLKLRLMERRSAFKNEEGFTEYKALYAAILGEAK